MNSKSFNSNEHDAIQAFIDATEADGNYVHYRNEGDNIIVEWVKNKKYTTYDNKEFDDKVWVTEKGEMIHIQDLSEEHAKNIIRMLMRQREESLKQLINVIESGISELAEDLGIESIASHPTLH